MLVTMNMNYRDKEQLKTAEVNSKYMDINTTYHLPVFAVYSCTSVLFPIPVTQVTPSRYLRREHGTLFMLTCSILKEDGSLNTFCNRCSVRESSAKG